MSILITIFFVVAFFKSVENCVAQLLGLSEKNKILTFLGLALGGVLLVLQAVTANRRAAAMEKIAGEQAKAIEQQAKANQNTEQGQRQERLKNAIEHLGNKEVSVRLGGAYQLSHLVQDTNNKRFRQYVRFKCDLLSSRIIKAYGS